MLLARNLDLEGFGIYTTVVAWVTIITLPAGGGMPMAATRFLPAYRAARQGADAAGFVRRAVHLTAAGSLGCAAGFVLLHAVAPGLRPFAAAALWGAVLLPVLAFLGLAAAVLQALQRPLAGELASNLLRAASVAALAAVALAGGWRLSPETALGCTVLAALGALAVTGTLACRTLRTVFPAAPARFADRPVWGRATRAFLLALAAAALLERLDVIVVGLLLDPAAAGAYGAASRLAAPVGLALAAVGAMLAPLSVQCLALGDTAGLQALSSRGAVLAVLLAAGPALVLTLAGSYLLTWFGPGFGGAAPSLRILALAYLLAAGLGTPTVLLMLAGHNRVALTFICGSVLVAAVVSVALVPVLGMAGAAAGTAVAFVVQGGAGAVAARRLLGVDTTLLGALRRHHRRAVSVG